ncbi:acyl carrier protein [Desulfobacter latus]|uniref:Acyl carrier protein n=1 Tax=Desulfobacter latus TaxID=2292 RepID=A0A850T905_9BACT|nr:acyl carrier protein [Desulfobacter latus]NWH04958.1 acyl carrier protein [Desulfobacter latus]
MTRGECREIIVRCIKEIVGNDDLPSQIEDDYNLIKAGVVDSLKFVKLVLLIEDKCGIKLELEKLSNEEFGTVRGFIMLLAKGIE